MENLVFTQLSIPEVKQLFRQELESFFNSLHETRGKANTREPEKYFSLPELCAYLPDKPARQTVYGWVHKNHIPFQKGSKKLRFKKSEIDAWLEQGGNKTLSQFEVETDQYLHNKKSA